MKKFIWLVLVLLVLVVHEDDYQDQVLNSAESGESE